jgi:putative methylase
MQERLARKLDLERMLSKVKPHPTPTPSLEQYTISAETAATVLYIAAYADRCVVGKNILDLGCGTGRLALGAAFLGAKSVTGIDIDKNAVKTASANASEAGLEDKLQWIVGDIDAVHGRFDTVLQNPPFGIQTRGADRKFITKALELGRVAYSLHKRPGGDLSLLRKIKTSSDGVVAVSGSPFMKRFVEENGGRIVAVYAMLMSVPHMFSFHTKKTHDFVVDLYVFEKNERR